MTPLPVPPRDDGLHPLAYVAMFMVLVLLAAMAFAREAPAHSWYPGECCHERDCAPVDARAVRAGPEGYTVRVAPGSHPMVPAGAPGQVHTIPHDKVRQAPDGEHHICLNARGDVLCFFAPPPGS